MTEFGYALSSEEHPPNDLVRYAQRAEGAGFSFAAISDHFHPWVDQHAEAIKAFVDAGYDHVYIHQIGPDQDGFFDFFERELHRRL